MEPFQEWYAKLAGKTSVFSADLQDVQVDLDIDRMCDGYTPWKTHREKYGRGPITSIFLAGEKEPFAIENWREENCEAPPTGVRTCPWDEQFWLVPILDKESGDIAGYGKMSMKLGRWREDSYTTEGEKEWMSFFWLEDIYGPDRARELTANNHFKTRTRDDGKVEYEVTECMLALLFFRSRRPCVTIRFVWVP